MHRTTLARLAARGQPRSRPRGDLAERAGAEWELWPAATTVQDEARRLLGMLKFVPMIPSEAIPNNSIIREFIGGSCFNV